MVAAWIGPAIVAAFISALVTGLGWLVSERQAARRETRARRERVVDMQVALLAEIEASRYDFDDLGEHGRSMDALMDEDEEYTPFVLQPVTPFVLDAVMADIHVLPTEVIGPVVTYYRQRALIQNLANDIRSEAYRALNQSRKRRVYQDYVRLLQEADGLAERARIAIGRSLNIPAPDSSGRRSGAGRGGVSGRTASVEPPPPGTIGPDEDKPGRRE